MSDKERLGSSRNTDDGGYRDMVERLVFASITEQRRARRWSIFFKFLLALYLLALLLLYMPRDWDEMATVGEKHSALVDLSGAITDSTEASADTVIGGQLVAIEEMALSVDRDVGTVLESEVRLRAVVHWKNLKTGDLMIDHRRVSASASYSAYQMQDFKYASTLAANNLARKIVELMEEGW